METMETILRQLSLLLALMYLYSRAGNAELIMSPRDTEVLVNHSTYFNCSTSIRNEQIHWYHYRVGENRTNIVYYKGEINKNYPNRYNVTINIETGEYNLIIHSVQSEDAGRYVCQDDGGRGRRSSAELIVLDADPICASNMKPDGLVGPNRCDLPIEELHLSCSVSYSGNIHVPPILQWKMEGEDTPISTGIAFNYSGESVMLNLTMSSNVEMDGASFTCGTTRSHHKQHSCTTDRVKINYAFDEPLILDITRGEIITCSANVSVPCTYRWFFYGNDTLYPASCTEVLATTRSENYSCEASCLANGFSCTFIARRIVVVEEATSTASEDKTKTLLLIVGLLIATVGFLLVTTCVLFFMIRKANIANKELKTRNAGIEKPMEQSRADNENQKQSPRTPAKFETDQEPTRAADVKTPLLSGRSGKTIDYAEKPILACKIQLSEKNKGKPINGIAILSNELFVVTERSNEIEVYDSETFQRQPIIEISEMTDPLDIASSKDANCLYIVYWLKLEKESKVARFDPKGNAFKRTWLTGGGKCRLSTYESNAILCLEDKQLINEYSPDGKLMVTVPLSRSVRLHKPLHAIKVSSTCFVVSNNDFKGNDLHLCMVDLDGTIQKECPKMKVPICLLEDSEGSILVADRYNNKILLLSSKLNYQRTLIEEDQIPVSKGSPVRLCFDDIQSKLFIAVNGWSSSKKKWKDGRILTFNIKK